MPAASRSCVGVPEQETFVTAIFSTLAPVSATADKTKSPRPPCS